LSKAFSYYKLVRFHSQVMHEKAFYGKMKRRTLKRRRR
jgi:hypothetical protein